MNKKGFTLIELLAVIAILAILIVMAVPNILNLYRNARVNSFITQAESLYKSAEQQIVSEQMKANADTSGTFCYTGPQGSTGTVLATNGSTAVHYYITYNSNGISTFFVEDGNYAVSLSSGTSISNISEPASGGTNYAHVTEFKNPITVCNAAPSEFAGNAVKINN